MVTEPSKMKWSNPHGTQQFDLPNSGPRVPSTRKWGFTAMGWAHFCRISGKSSQCPPYLKVGFRVIWVRRFYDETWKVSAQIMWPASHLLHPHPQRHNLALWISLQLRECMGWTLAGTSAFVERSTDEGSLGMFRLWRLRSKIDQATVHQNE